MSALVNSAKKHTHSPAHSPLRILLVEDNDDTAWSMAALLGRHGYEIEVTKDGPSALQVSATYQPDVVLLDIGMPEMDGWQLARQIRQQQNGRQPVLIAVTGYATTADRQRSQEAGINLHFAKPADPKELLEVLAKLSQIGRQELADSA